MVERMELEQLRENRRSIPIHTYTLSTVCMEEYGTCSILGYLAVISLRLVHYCEHCPTECPGHSGYSTTVTVRRHIKQHIGNLYSVECMYINQNRIEQEQYTHTHIYTQHCMHGRIWDMQHPGILGSDQSEISPLLCTLPNRMSRTFWLQYYSNCTYDIQNNT